MNIYNNQEEIKQQYLSDEPNFPAALIIGMLFIGAFFGYLNDTLLNVALPTLMDEFQVSKTTIQWLATGFLLVMGAFTPITASLLSWFQTRTIVLTTQFIFIIGSLICTFAPNFQILLFGRMVQAITAAMFVPTLFNGILAIYPPHKRGTAMGVVSMMFTVAPALGPTISGLIVDYWHWRALFAMGIPFMLLAMVVTAKFLTVNLNELTHPQIDIPSAMLSVTGFSGLIYASSNFTELTMVSFSVLMIISITLIARFTKRQFTLETPLLNLRAFLFPQFRYAMGVLVVAYFIFMGLELILPIYLQRVLMLAATATGLILMPASIVQAISSPLFGKLLDVKGGKFVILPAVIFLLIALTAMTLTFDVHTSTWLISALFAVLAASVTACITGETHGLNALSYELNPHGAAIIATLTPIAAAIGMSFFVGLTNIGEHLSTNTTSQQAMLNGMYLAMTCAIFIAVGALFFALKIKENQSTHI